MNWPFRKKRDVPTRHAAPSDREQELGLYEKGAQNLIAQGMPAWKVERAMKLVRRYVREGALPEGSVHSDPE
ncbi:MAG: hypothetical protein FJX77_17090 [Armatimonadetes bacterium]|nr:hypothetical protein [Armatimonadota bacterium]